MPPATAAMLYISPRSSFQPVFLGYVHTVIGFVFFTFDVAYIFVAILSSWLFVGNKKSLADAMEKGINLRDHILKLYHDNYCGGSMKLVVIGGGKFLHDCFRNKSDWYLSICLHSFLEIYVEVSCTIGSTDLLASPNLLIDLLNPSVSKYWKKYWILVW